jgi:hypothetical protein
MNEDLFYYFLILFYEIEKKELRWRKDNKKTNVTLKSSRFVGHKIFFKILITYISMMSKYNIKIQQVFIHYKHWANMPICMYFGKG